MTKEDAIKIIEKENIRNGKVEKCTEFDTFFVCSLVGKEGQYLDDALYAVDKLTGMIEPYNPIQGVLGENMKLINTSKNELKHYGTKGQKWGVRRYQNADGTLTEDCLYHSDTYLGADYSDGIRHFKYISRKKKNGKWIYVYEKDDNGALHQLRSKNDKTVVQKVKGKNYSNYSISRATNSKKDDYDRTINIGKNIKIYSGKEGNEQYSGVRISSGSLGRKVTSGKGYVTKLLSKNK